MSIEEMQKAIEALEKLKRLNHGVKITTVKTGEIIYPEQIAHEAITSLRQAIADAEQAEPNLTEQGRNKSAVFGNNIKEMMDAGLPFFAALQTTLQVYDHPTNVASSDTSQERVDEIAKQRHEQEPVAWLSTDGIGERYLCFDKPLDNDPMQALYTHPPQRQPLTDEIPQGVLFAINKAGLTLLKTQHGYELQNIGPAIAHGIKGEA